MYIDCTDEDKTVATKARKKKKKSVKRVPAIGENTDWLLPGSTGAAAGTALPPARAAAVGGRGQVSDNSGGAARASPRSGRARRGAGPAGGSSSAPAPQPRGCWDAAEGAGCDTPRPHACGRWGAGRPPGPVGSPGEAPSRCRGPAVSLTGYRGGRRGRGFLPGYRGSNRSDEPVKNPPRRPSCCCVCRRDGSALLRAPPQPAGSGGRRGGEGRWARPGRSAGCGATAPLRSLPRACAPASHMLTAPAAGAHTPQGCGSALRLR